MNKAFSYFFLLLLLGTTGMWGCSDNYQPVPDEKKEEKEEVMVKTIHGVCRQNLQRESYGKVVEIANNIANSDIPAVRIAGVKAGGSIRQVIHNINTFAQKGIKVLLIQPKNAEMFPKGYEQLPGPSHSVYEMSAIDTDRFRVFIDNLLEQIALHTPENALIGFELFNEANWAGFNGDLRPTSEGKGEVFKLDTPFDLPAYQKVYAGINTYGKCLQITRESMDTHIAGRDVKLITNGMVIGGSYMDYTGPINNGYSVVTPDAFLTLLQGKHPQQTDKTNYLQFADGIGIHAYPPLEVDMESFLRTYYFEPMDAVLQTPMPYWMTEWGFARPQFRNIGGEERRLQYFRSFIEAIESIGNTAMTALYEFDAATDNHNIWENGELLESGTIFQEINP